MKKSLVLLVAIMFLLVGCKQEKFYLEDEHYGKVAVTEIDSDKLKTLEKDKKNFGVFVYLPGCSSCAEFSEVLDTFTNDNKIEFYSISILDAKDTGVSKVEFAPSLVLYNEGKVVDLLDSTSDDDKPYFKDSDKLKEWLDKYIYLEK